MPSRSFKTCTYPGCAALTKSGRCDRHRKQVQKEYDTYRRDKESSAFYRSTAWRKCREAVLERDYHLCQVCLAKGILTPATLVHHKELVRESREKELLVENLISVCAACHSAEHPSERFGNKRER